jgi:hypothetical protein
MTKHREIVLEYGRKIAQVMDEEGAAPLLPETWDRIHDILEEFLLEVI